MPRIAEQLWRLLLSAGISLGILALMFHLVTPKGGDADPATVLQVLHRASLPLAAWYLGFQIAQTLLRSERYRLLVRAGGEMAVPGRLRFFLVTVARNMFVDLLPARLGELSYIAMLNRGYHVRGRACVSSLAVAFLFDFIALLVIVGGACALPLLASDLRGPMLVTATALVVLVLVAGLVLFAWLRPLLRLARRFADPLLRFRVVTTVLAFADDVAGAFDNTRRAGIFWQTLLLSLGVRACKYSGLYFAFLAVARPSFEPLAQAPFWNVLVALLAAEATASLPLPTFMSFGAYEAGGLLALSVLGFSAASSAAAMLAIHILSQLVDYTMGGLALVAFLTTGSTQTTPVAARNRPARPLLLAGACALALLVAAGALLAQYRAQQKRGALSPPPAGTSLPAAVAEEPRFNRTVQSLRGFLVWSSNRFGNHDILMMSLPDGTISQLTTNSHAETYPRISPDGRTIVFCRSRIPWVSQRDTLPWDVILLDIATREERLIAEHGYTPTWSADGATIYFQREGHSVVSHAVETGEERVLFRSGVEPVPEGVQLQTPDFNAATGQLVATLRGNRSLRITALFGLDGTFEKIGDGSQCQVAWSRDHSFLYVVGHGGRQQNLIYRLPLDTREPIPWLDLPGEYSHEYFPRLSYDSRYLVLGASNGARNQHEHDTSDYELFVWEVGAPAEEAVRFTHHTGNDCWPDLFVLP